MGTVTVPSPSSNYAKQMRHIVASAEGYLAWVIYMPQLVSFAASHGYAVFFITGRPQTQTDATVTNLTQAGYPAPQAGHLFLKPATPPPYLHCVNAPTCTTIEYKSGTRAHRQRGLLDPGLPPRPNR